MAMSAVTKKLNIIPVLLPYYKVGIEELQLDSENTKTLVLWCRDPLPKLFKPVKNAYEVLYGGRFVS